MRGNRVGKVARAFAVGALAFCAGTAGAFGIGVQPADPPVADPAAVEAAEKAAQQMEDMFEDMPMDFNPAGMTSGEGMFGAFFGPSVTKGDFKAFVKILGLDKDQAAAAEVVYAQRLMNYEAKGKPFQDLIMEALKGFGESMRRGEPEREPENIEQLSKAGDEIQREREAMAKGVMEDLKALATQAQLERWPKVEMAERRNVLMRFQPMMMAPGALVDVRAVIETTLSKPGIEPPVEMGRQRIEEALETRDLALDEQARRAVPIDATMRASSIRNKPTPEEMEAMMKAMGEGMQIAEQVRKANETAVKSIAAVLSDSSRAVFMDEYRARAFPAIYREMHSERVLATAIGLSDLSDEQREKIRVMRDEHLAKLKDLRPKAADQMIEQQQVQAEYMAAKDDEARMRVAERMGKIYSENFRMKMRESDREIVKQVRAALTEAQREKLPKRPRPNLPFEITPTGDDGSK
jgi:hypothetical protein